MEVKKMGARTHNVFDPVTNELLEQPNPRDAAKNDTYRRSWSVEIVPDLSSSIVVHLTEVYIPNAGLVRSDVCNFFFSWREIAGKLVSDAHHLNKYTLVHYQAKLYHEFVAKNADLEREVGQSYVVTNNNIKYDWLYKKAKSVARVLALYAVSRSVIHSYDSPVAEAILDAAGVTFQTSRSRSNHPTPTFNNPA